LGYVRTGRRLSGREGIVGRRGFLAELARIERERQRAINAQLRAQERAVREAERARKTYERAQAAEEKEKKRLYVESRLAEVEAKNKQLEAYLVSLENLLDHTLNVDDFLDFERLKQEPEIPPFQPGELARPEPVPQIALPSELSAIGKLVPGAKARHEKQVEEAKVKHEMALREHSEREATRQKLLAEEQAKYEAMADDLRQAATERNAEIDDFQKRFEVGEPDAIVSYFDLVLQSSSYPEAFPRHTKIAYVPESKQLVVELELPRYEIVPTASVHKYVRARDEIAETPRPATQRRALYRKVIAQVAIRTIHEIFEADRAQKVDTIVLNGFVDTVDKGTGQRITPYLVTVRTVRDVFESLDLANVEPEACLKHLNASLSKSPEELAPVRPVLEFSMVDARFVEESDVLSTLDQRPNLMELRPSEFESLITNLFEKMGLETRLTQASRDGGVDCVAYDPRPIFGGKVVIQAKRYKNTVGVSAVRDLYGTMQNEGASKGILVTTSGYGKAAFEFADGKPMELLGGSNLLCLLANHAGIEARIEVPDDWEDPPPEM
jgi:restriction system protein